MTNAWADLPNAKSIDEVLAARGAARTATWNAARGAAQDAAQDAAWGAAWAAAWAATWNGPWDAARGAAWDAARGAAWDSARAAVAALITWDDAAELYPLTPAQLRLTAALLPDNDHRRHAAVLLRPYAISREMCDD